MRNLYLAIAFIVGLAGCAPKYGIYWEHNFGAYKPEPRESPGNYANDAVMTYSHLFGGEPISFAWRGDQLWVLWKEEPKGNSLQQFTEYRIIPHPVSSGINSIVIMESDDWDAYTKWIKAGAPRLNEAYYDRVKHKIIWREKSE